MSRSTSKFLSLNEIPSSSVATSSYCCVSTTMVCLLLSAQVAAGCDLIAKLHSNLVPSGVSRVVWVDGHGYDSWPTLACMEASWLSVMSARYSSEMIAWNGSILQR